MSMFEYVFASESEAARRASQRELDRFVAWVRSQPGSEQVMAALAVVEQALSACASLSFEQYQQVCGAAAALSYVALDADGFEWLWSFFRDVPRLFHMDWSSMSLPVEAEMC